MSNDPNVLKVSVAEEIKMRDVPPGMPAPTKEQQEEKLPPDEIEKRQRIMLEYTRLSGRYVEPHDGRARWVVKEDLPRLLADGKDMVAMCNIPRGKYSGISALSHVEIENRDPLRFFVLPNGMVVINPIITEHTENPIYKDEGCMMFPQNDVKKDVTRYNKVTVTYQTLARQGSDGEPTLSAPVTEKLSGGPSHVFQHECQHLNGSNVFREDHSPDAAIGFGDGQEVILDALYKDELPKAVNEN